MFSEKVTPFPIPPSDPRDPKVAVPAHALATSTAPDVPPGLMADPEAPSSGNRLHLALDEIDTDFQRLEARDAIGRLVDLHGVEDVYRWLRYHALRRGVLLPDPRG